MKYSRQSLFVCLLSAVALGVGVAPEPAKAAGYEVLHTFSGPDGGEPHASTVVFDNAGNLYGATFWGGAYGAGTVYKMTPNADGSWAHRVIHSFSGPDGQWPAATPIFDAVGNLYGTTVIGGRYGCGVVYKLRPNTDGSWSRRVLHVFTGGWDGCESDYGDLIFDAAGNLYGATDKGGIYGHGVVFKLRPNARGGWNEIVLHSFRGGRDGSNPRASLVFDRSGSLYGTTREGGLAGKGTVFKLTRGSDGRWTNRVLHHFYGRPAANPFAGLIMDAAGNLYGTTEHGGPINAGTVFTMFQKADGSWGFQTIHVFNGGDGAMPWASLVFDGSGNLYGTTVHGGPRNAGTVFKLTRADDGSWTEQVLHTFSPYDGGGGIPEVGVVLDPAGNIYGTANYYGNLSCDFGGGGCGTVFKIVP